MPEGGRQIEGQEGREGEVGEGKRGQTAKGKEGRVVCSVGSGQEVGRVLEIWGVPRKERQNGRERQSVREKEGEAGMQRAGRWEGGCSFGGCQRRGEGEREGR